MIRQNRRPLPELTARAGVYAIACATLALAACSDPAPERTEEAPPPVMEEPVAPVEEAPPPAVVEAPPHDSSTLPTDSRTSEESVRPESETLFY